MVTSLINAAALHGTCEVVVGSGVAVVRRIVAVGWGVAVGGRGVAVAGFGLMVGVDVPMAI
jgi:hypothetical protein